MHVKYLFSLVAIGCGMALAVGGQTVSLEGEVVDWPLGRTMALRDPIGNRDLGTGDRFAATVPVHGVRLIRERAGR